MTVGVSFPTRCVLRSVRGASPHRRTTRPVSTLAFGDVAPEGQPKGRGGFIYRGLCPAPGDVPSVG